MTKDKGPEIIRALVFVYMVAGSLSNNPLEALPLLGSGF